MISRSEVIRVNRKFRQAQWAQLDFFPINRGYYPDWPEPVILEARHERSVNEVGCAYEYELLLARIASEMVNDETRW